MGNIWERFDGMVKPEEVAEAKAQFGTLDAGDYTMKLESLEPAENKDGLPMLKGSFRIPATNKLAFYNQNLQNMNFPQMTAVNIAEAVNFVGDLMGEEIEFTTLSDLADKASSIPLGSEYQMRISYNAKDVDQKFSKFKVLKPLEDIDGGDEDMGDEEVPF